LDWFRFILSSVRYRNLSASILLLALLVVFPAVNAFPTHAPSLPSGASTYSLLLAPKEIEPFKFSAYATNNIVQYSSNSNVSVTVSLMTSQNFQSFRETRSDIAADSVYYKNGTSIQGNIKFAPGSYVLLVFPPSQKVGVMFTYQLYPNNPYSYGVSAPESAGIASFGVTNQSGVDNPYAVRSTDLVGVAGISAIQALNTTAEELAQVPQTSLSLQLNSVLVVNEAGGDSQVYWIQNTPVLNTATTQLQMSDNIWNFSRSGFLSSSTITSQGGLGLVYSYRQDGVKQYYYDYEGNNETYTLPLGLVLLINATVTPGTGVLVQLGAKTVQGTGLATQVSNSWFDNVTIHDPTVQSSYFLTSGNDTTPDGLYYDTEFAFAGDANGESTNFPVMNSGLGLFYTNGSASQSLTPFPSYFNFGFDTQEGADNLKVTYTGNGLVQVGVGTPDFAYLGQATGSYSLNTVEDRLGISTGVITSSTSSATSSSTTTNSSSSQTSSGSSSTTSMTSNSTVSSSSSVASNTTSSVTSTSTSSSVLTTQSTSTTTVSSSSTVVQTTTSSAPPSSSTTTSTSTSTSISPPYLVGMIAICLVITTIAAFPGSRRNRAAPKILR
jgi:Thermopsin